VAAEYTTRPTAKAAVDAHLRRREDETASKPDVFTARSSANVASWIACSCLLHGRFSIVEPQGAGASTNCDKSLAIITIDILHW
jgi:hypothetical protein